MFHVLLIKHMYICTFTFTTLRESKVVWLPKLKCFIRVSRVIGIKSNLKLTSKGKSDDQVISRFHFPFPPVLVVELNFIFGNVDLTRVVKNNFGLSKLILIKF